MPASPLCLTSCGHAYKLDLMMTAFAPENRGSSAPHQWGWHIGVFSATLAAWPLGAGDVPVAGAGGHQGTHTQRPPGTMLSRHHARRFLVTRSHFKPGAVHLEHVCGPERFVFGSSLPEMLFRPLKSCGSVCGESTSHGCCRERENSVSWAGEAPGAFAGRDLNHQKEVERRSGQHAIAAVLDRLETT